MDKENLQEEVVTQENVAVADEPGVQAASDDLDIDISFDTPAAPVENVQSLQEEAAALLRRLDEDPSDNEARTRYFQVASKLQEHQVFQAVQTAIKPILERDKLSKFSALLDNYASAYAREYGLHTDVNFQKQLKAKKAEAISNAKNLLSQYSDIKAVADGLAKSAVAFALADYMKMKRKAGTPPADAVPVSAPAKAAPATKSSLPKELEGRFTPEEWEQFRPLIEGSSLEERTIEL